MEQPVLPAVVLELSRWSLGVQFAVVTLLAFFFVAFSRTVRLQEVRLWAAAWIADASALFCVILVSFFQAPPWLARIALVGYAAGKTTYALLIVAGARNHLRRGTEVPLAPGTVALLVGAWSLCLGLFAQELIFVQLGQCVMVGALMTYGGLWVLLRPRAALSRWLGWAILAEGILFLHYVPMLAPLTWMGAPLAEYLRYPSFIDAGAELLVALASLVALESSANEDLRHINRELEASQERLRQLIDVDPLTNLLNRRGFREEIERRQKQNTTLIFFDVDDFKEINDRFGHVVGDRCLRRVSLELARAFRPEDSVFRWGGDEFLVLCEELDPAGAWRRVEELRARLALPSEEIPACRIAAGVSLLLVGREAEAALAEADERMFEDKQRQKARP